MKLSFQTQIATPFVAASMLVLSTSGCRYNNTASAPMSQSSALQPVSPMQAPPVLAPIQPMSGFSSTGSSTRVPPPATGSYNAQSSIAPPAPSTNGTSNGYGPTGFQSSTAPDSGGFAATGSNSGVQQTGWVGSGTENGNTFGQSFHSPAPGASSAGSSVAPASQNSIQMGGRNVIDLTSAPPPPGYVPPSNTANFQSSQPYSQSQPYPQSQSFQSQAPLGAPVNSTTPRSSFTPTPPPQQIEAKPATEAEFVGASLPSTEPFPTDQGFPTGSAASSTSESLQWRRPSPRF